MDGTYPGSDRTHLARKRGITRQDGEFQRLKEDEAVLGLNQIPDQYGVSCTQKYGVSDDAFELEPSDTAASRIHVSQRIDIVSSQRNRDDRLGFEYV